MCRASSSGSDCAASTSSVSTCHSESRAHHTCSACNHQTNQHITHTDRDRARTCAYARLFMPLVTQFVVVKYTQPTHTPYCRKVPGNPVWYLNTNTHHPDPQVHLIRLSLRPHPHIPCLSGIYHTHTRPTSAPRCVPHTRAVSFVLAHTFKNTCTSAHTRCEFCT